MFAAQCKHYRTFAVSAICRSARNFATGETSERTDHPPQWPAHLSESATRRRGGFASGVLSRNSAALTTAAEVKVYARGFGPQSVCPLRVCPLRVCPLRVCPLRVCPLLSVCPRM
jgi:hypothetical protein